MPLVTDLGFILKGVSEETARIRQENIDTENLAFDRKMQYLASLMENEALDEGVRNEAYQLAMDLTMDSLGYKSKEKRGGRLNKVIEGLFGKDAQQGVDLSSLNQQVPAGGQRRGSTVGTISGGPPAPPDGIAPTAQAGPPAPPSGGFIRPFEDRLAEQVELTEAVTDAETRTRVAAELETRNEIAQEIIKVLPSLGIELDDVQKGQVLSNITTGGSATITRPSVPTQRPDSFVENRMRVEDARRLFGDDSITSETGWVSVERQEGVPGGRPTAWFPAQPPFAPTAGSVSEQQTENMIAAMAETQGIPAADMRRIFYNARGEADMAGFNASRMDAELTALLATGVMTPESANRIHGIITGQVEFQMQQEARMGQGFSGPGFETRVLQEYARRGINFENVIRLMSQGQLTVPGATPNIDFGQGGRGGAPGATPFNRIPQ